MSSRRDRETTTRTVTKKKRLGFISGLFLGGGITLLIIFLFVWYALLEAPTPWKVTNASDPRFVPFEFKYTDYHSQSELKDALKTMFPVGTSKEKVDEILVEAGGGTTEKYDYKHQTLKDKITYRYRYNNFFRKLPIYILSMSVPLPPFEEASHRVSIDYDEDHKVIRVTVLSVFGLPAFFVKKSEQRKSLEKAIKNLHDE